MEAAHKTASEKPEFSEYDYSNFYHGAGDDPLNLLRPFAQWYSDARPNGYYLYQEALGSAPTTHVRVKNGKTGQWQELLDLAIVAEELGYAATPGPFLASAMATVALAHADDVAVKSKWLPKLASGESVGAIAIGEANEEWGLDRLTTRATAGGLTGKKPLVAGAGVADLTAGWPAIEARFDDQRREYLLYD
mgnify:CR=1 FL=1